MKKLATLFVCVLLLTSALASAQVTRLLSMRDASGALTADDDPAALPSTGNFVTAEILLDITTITTPDADDKICFYIQTTYNLVDWTDVESVCVDNSDNGSTRKVPIIIDGVKDGPGSVQTITGTDPAAGAEISESVPANTEWLLTAFRFALVTDATSGTRQVHLHLDDGTTTFIELPATGTQIVSLTRDYNAHGLGGMIVPTGDQIDISLPSGIMLAAGYRLSTSTTDMESGDDFGAPQIQVEAWCDPSISTDGTLGDGLKCYDRPVGMQLRVKAIVTGATAPTYAYSASVLLREKR